MKYLIFAIALLASGLFTASANAQQHHNHNHQTQFYPVPIYRPYVVQPQIRFYPHPVYQYNPYIGYRYNPYVLPYTPYPQYNLFPSYQFPSYQFQVRVYR